MVYNSRSISFPFDNGRARGQMKLADTCPRYASPRIPRSKPARPFVFNHPLVRAKLEALGREKAEQAAGWRSACLESRKGPVAGVRRSHGAL